LLKEVTERLAQDLEETDLSSILGPEVTLVPSPRSAPLFEGALWPAQRVAAAMVAAGLGRDTLCCLRRVEAVPKSAFQAHGERPNAVRHYETMQVQAGFDRPVRITLVDDFVTKGNTLLGGASRIAEAYPDARISVFALVRTLGLQPEIDRLTQPCLGEIRHLNGDAVREP